MEKENELKNIIPLTDEYLVKKCLTKFGGAITTGTFKMQYADCPLKFKNNEGETITHRGWYLTFDNIQIEK